MSKLYVNIYEVGCAYGGAEEGGWYYDFGTPAEKALHKSFDKKEDAIAYRDTIRNKLNHLNENRLHPHQVNSNGDYLVVYIEEHPASPFPEEKPYYE